MKVSVVRFSRPILIMTDPSKYETIYGFVVDGPLEGERVYDVIRGYVGYLCGLADYASGGSEFSICFFLNGLPNWVDDRGVMHLMADNWMDEIGSKCMKKLNLTYAIVQMEIDEDTYDECVDEEGLIIDEDLFDDIEISLRKGMS